MKIRFLGATRTTTGSMYLMEINDRKILLECGLYQGRRAESIERNCCFPFPPASLDAVILSHAHLDHCGNLPNLTKQGFRGNIYCTFATRSLASIMLEDSAHIQKADAEFISRHRAKSGLPPVEPLYSPTDAEMAIRQFVAVGYDRPMPVAEGVTVTFRDAGHILGSAQVVLDLRETATGRKLRYLFTGDIGRGDDLILRDPEAVEDVDVLQIESTYGGREHQSKDNACEMLQSALKTLENGGKVIVPAFSVGRTQQFVYMLNQFSRERKLPDAPIFVDSPLSVNATEVHRLHPECFNEETYRFLRDVASPFQMGNLTYIRDLAQSKKLNDLKGPAIIISASGMAEAGRIRHHLSNHIGKVENLILFIGFCAEHTLGYQILSGKNPVNIFGEPHEVRARVLAVDYLSGHADRSELLGHVRKLTGPMREIFVIHGEEAQSLAFAEALRQEKPQSRVTVPQRGEMREF